MKFGTKFLMAGGEGGGSQTNPGEAGQEKKPATIDDVLALLGSLTETVKSNISVVDELKKKIETKPEDKKKDVDVKSNQTVDNSVTKEYIDSLLKGFTETITKSTSETFTGILKQRDDTAKIQDFLNNVPEENKKVATALVAANTGKKPVDEIFKEIEGLGLTIPATNGYTTTIPKGMTTEQYLATTDLAKELMLTEDDYKGSFLKALPGLVKAAKYHGTKVFLDFLNGGKK